MLMGVKLKFKPKQSQLNFFEQNANASRFIYNNALGAIKTNYDQTGKFLPITKLINMIPAIKKIPGCEWLKECESSSLQQSARNLDQGLQNFFNSKNGNRAGRPVGFPNFKKKGKCKHAFTVANNSYGIFFKDDRLKIPKLGFVKVWNAKNRFKLMTPSDDIKSATFSKDSDGCWYASLTVDFKNSSVKYTSTGETDGLDVGIKTTATLKNGSVNLPERIAILERKVKKLNRQLHRKKLGSKNREKAKAKLSKCYYTIAQIRKNFMHQLSHFIAKNVDILTVETLNIQGMMKNRKLARSIGRQGWYMLITFLKYKLEDNWKTLIQVNRSFPSSKLCSTCGYEYPNMDLSIRDWICPSCNTIHDRDQNAAKNLDNVSRWFKLTGEMITSKKNYIESISPNLGTF